MLKCHLPSLSFWCRGLKRLSWFGSGTAMEIEGKRLFTNKEKQLFFVVVAIFAFVLENNCD